MRKLMIVLALLAALGFSKATRTQPQAHTEKAASHATVLPEAGLPVNSLSHDGDGISRAAMLRAGILTFPLPKSELGFGWGAGIPFGAEPFVFRSPDTALASRSSMGM
jgi:hypothetical protein